MYPNFGYYTRVIGLQIAITKSGVNTTRRRALISVLDRFIFDSVIYYESLILQLSFLLFILENMIWQAKTALGHL